MISPSAFALSRRVAPAGAALSRIAIAAACGLAGWIAACHARASQRRTLLDLDDRLLRDVGLTRSAARREAAKPWWRP